jgi:hypothetical protein
MNEIKTGEIRYFAWGNEGIAKIGNRNVPLVSLWTVLEDRSVRTIGLCPKETARAAGWVMECPYS